MWGSHSKRMRIVGERGFVEWKQSFPRGCCYLVFHFRKLVPSGALTPSFLEKVPSFAVRRSVVLHSLGVASGVRLARSLIGADFIGRQLAFAKIPMAHNHWWSFREKHGVNPANFSV